LARTTLGEDVELEAAFREYRSFWELERSIAVAKMRSLLRDSGEIELPDLATVKSVLHIIDKAVAKMGMSGCVNSWLVGSILDASRPSSDIDVLLTYCHRRSQHVSVGDIEALLWLIRRASRLALNIRADTFFRADDQLVTGGILRPDRLLHTWVLELTKFSPQKLLGSTLNVRRVGKISVVYSRRAKDTNFFGKLPTDSDGNRLLRPGIRISEYLGSYCLP
jgi:hypothetical protein